MIRLEGWGGVGIALLLTACGHAPEPKIITQEVRVEVVRPCVGKNVPGRETYADTPSALKNAAGPDVRYHLMASEYARKNARLGLLEDVVAACR